MGGCSFSIYNIAYLGKSYKCIYKIITERKGSPASMSNEELAEQVRNSYHVMYACSCKR